jgi:hypothetical protein
MSDVSESFSESERSDQAASSTAAAVESHPRRHSLYYLDDGNATFLVREFFSFCGFELTNIFHFY